MVTSPFKQMFGGIYSGKTILLTGHTGFKGSWLSRWLEFLGAKIIGYSHDVPTEPSHWNLIHSEIEDIRRNVQDVEFLTGLLQEKKPDLIFHLAAQALVLKSYDDPFLTYADNVMGSLSLYEAVRRSRLSTRIVSVTTDKVYRNLGVSRGYTENDELGGADPYSASKAAMEIMTRSYVDSFFPKEQFNKDHSVLMATVRSGNVIGGGDWAQDRLIPDLVRSAMINKPLVIRHPDAVRPWQHVLDPLNGYLMLGQKLLESKREFAEAWNFGPDPNEKFSVRDVLNIATASWKKVQIEFETDSKKHEEKILTLDSTKAIQGLGWRPQLTTAQAIKETMEWYRDWYEEKTIQTDSQLSSFSCKLEMRQL